MYVKHRHLNYFCLLHFDRNFQMQTSKARAYELQRPTEGEEIVGGVDEYTGGSHISNIFARYVFDV